MRGACLFGLSLLHLLLWAGTPVATAPPPATPHTSAHPASILSSTACGQWEATTSPVVVGATAPQFLFSDMSEECVTTAVNPLTESLAAAAVQAGHLVPVTVKEGSWLVIANAHFRNGTVGLGCASLTMEPGSTLGVALLPTLQPSQLSHQNVTSIPVVAFPGACPNNLLQGVNLFVSGCPLATIQGVKSPFCCTVVAKTVEPSTCQLSADIAGPLMGANLSTFWVQLFIAQSCATFSNQVIYTAVDQYTNFSHWMIASSTLNWNCENIVGGGVMASFRCVSHTAADADVVCEHLFASARSGPLGKALGVTSASTARITESSSRRDASLLGLLSLLVIPVGLAIYATYRTWKTTTSGPQSLA